MGEPGRCSWMMSTTGCMSLQFARQTGYLKGRRMKVAVDTTYILGRGAVKDTYNLLADGIVQVVRALSDLDGTRPEEWALSNSTLLQCEGGRFDGHTAG